MGAKLSINVVTCKKNIDKMFFFYKKFVHSKVFAKFAVTNVFDRNNFKH